MSDEELAVMIVDHAEWMASSGQYGGSVDAYLSHFRYRSEETRLAVLAEWARRKQGGSTA